MYYRLCAVCLALSASIRLAGPFLLLPICFPLAAFMQAENPKFELRGKILLPSGEIDTSVRPQVLLQAIRTIFYDRVAANPDWTFRFKGLEPGKYTLVVIAQGLGTLKKTVVIGASQADSKGRIPITVTLTSTSVGSAEVSAVELAIPEEAKKEYQKALNSMGKEDRQGAILHLEKAVELAPHFADAWNRLGTIAYKAEEYVKAERYFREALEQDPTSYPPLVNLGAALLFQDKLKDALRVNQEAVERQPGDPLAHAQLGGAYFALGNLNLAEEHLKIAKSKDVAHFSNPQLMLAKIYIRREDYRAVIEELEEFLRIHPDYPFSGKLEEVIRLARGKLESSAGIELPEP